MAGTLWGQRERSSRQPGASSYLNGFPWQSLMESVPGQQQGLGPGKRPQRRPLRQGAGVPGGWAGVGGQRVDPWLRNLQPGGKPCGWLRTAIRSAARCAPPPQSWEGGKSQYLTCTGGRKKSAPATPTYWPKGQVVSSVAQQSRPVPSALSCQVLLSVGAKATSGLPGASQPPAAPLSPPFTSWSLLLTSSHSAFAFPTAL